MIAFEDWKDGAVAATHHQIAVVAPRSTNLKLEAVSSRLKGEKPTRMVPENARGGGDLHPQDLPQPHIHLIEAATGAIGEMLISLQCFSNDACFSPDGRTLATGGHGRVLLWDMTKMPQ